MSSGTRPKTLLVYLCTFAGACLGTFGFFGIAFLAWPNPLSNALRSSISTLGRDSDQIVRIAEVQRISELIQSGYVVTTNELLTSVASYYGTLVSVLLGLIALLAAGAYLTIRGNSMSHVEDVVADKVREGSDHYFESISFGELVIGSIGKIRKIDSEAFQNELEGIRASLEDLMTWRASVQSAPVASELSPEEPDENLVVPETGAPQRPRETT
jgi:hypothetical protein